MSWYELNRLCVQDPALLLTYAALENLCALVHLKLDIGIFYDYLEPSLVKSTPQLTYLDLSGNGFKKIPSAITKLTNLRSLILADTPLQLGKSCLETMKVLTHLQTLDLRKGISSDSRKLDHDWNAESLELLWKVDEQLPELIVHF